MLKTISDQSFLDLKAKGWWVSTNSLGFVCFKNEEPTGPAFGSAQEAWVHIEATENAAAIKVATKEIPVPQAFRMTGAYRDIGMSGSRWPCESLDAPYSLPAGFTSRAGSGDIVYRDAVFKV